MLQKVIIRNNEGMGPTGYPISEIELEEMLKKGTAELFSEQNPNIYKEVESTADAKPEVDQTYNTRDMVSNPGTRSNRRSRAQNRRQQRQQREVTASTEE